jgi:hypothetical protein
LEIVQLLLHRNRLTLLQSEVKAVVHLEMPWRQPKRAGQVRRQVGHISWHLIETVDEKDGL